MLLELELDTLHPPLDMSDERESLLAAEHRADSPRSRRRARPRPNPLPKVQLAVVYAIKLVVPIASTQAMPYMNVLVSELAASSGAETGYYSGLVVRVQSTIIGACFEPWTPRAARVLLHIS